MTTPLLRRFVLLLSLLLLSTGAFATAQAPDIIVVDGKAESLFTNPLEPYLAAHPQALPRSNLVSSGNWRGYVATWAIEDGQLVLRKIEQEYSEEGKDYAARDMLKHVFPERQRIVADWYTGALVLPQGKMVNYVHMGYGSTYSDYRLIVIRDGRVLRDLKLDAKAFLEYRKARFEAFRKTDLFQKKLAELQARDGYDEKMALGFLSAYYAEQYLSTEDTAQ